MMKCAPGLLQEGMTYLLQLLPELQLIQIGLGDCLDPVEGSRKIAGNGGDCI